MLKKNNIIPCIHNMSPEYAQKMINLGFKLVTIGADQRYMSAGAKTAIDKIKLTTEKNISKTY